MTLWEAHQQAEAEAERLIKGTGRDAFFDRCRVYRRTIQSLIPAELHQQIEASAKQESGYSGANREKFFIFCQVYRTAMKQLAEENRLEFPIPAEVART